MNDFADPPRLRSLRDESGATLANVLEDVHAEGPTLEQVRDVEQRLQAALALPFAAAGGGSTVALSGKAALLGKFASLVAAPLGIGAVLGVVTASVVPSMMHSKATAPHAVVSSSQTVRSQPLNELPKAVRPVAETAPETPEIVASAQPPARSRTALSLPSSNPEPETPSAATELSLLAQAQAALASDPARALSLVNAHEREFGFGKLSQEREVIAISALLKLGRRSEAEARARMFQSQFADSAYSRRVDVLMGESK